MERTFKLRYTDGSPVAESELGLIRHGQDYRAETDSNGQVKIDFPADWVDRMEIDGQTVRTDWDIGSKKDLTYESFKIPKPGELRPEDVEHLPLEDAPEREGLVGRYYHADGTSPYEARVITVDFTNGQRGSTNDRGGYSRSDGQFFIPGGRKNQGWRPSKYFVDRDEIPGNHASENRDDAITLILPKHMGSKGSGGGIITGHVLDPDGAKAVNAKVVGELGGWFNSGGGTTFTDKDGKFVLQFEGGIALKTLYVDGHEPNSIERVGREGHSDQLSAKALHAGMFNLRIVRYKRRLGLF